ncbi:phosphatidylinositol-binding protein scs2 [Dimargaris verticillata]|uniref:Phosphatidylinositol-binding protein scs2 n=1 Tax=Dimargaris verticillata TaxID=2761393 RepID=A0A9W8B9W5_9FUNG|nr:phosphatidylinositol-binding protein scs2 [Dimargaris verticillata]
MSLVITPSNHLSFQRPFTGLTEDVLSLKNTTSSPIAFKVKTTAPKQYCVRPNSGRIEAGLELRVQVVLQPIQGDIPLNFKCKDKFLVQSVEVTPELETLSLNELWPAVERANKKLVREHKLRCVYLPPKVEEPESSAAAQANRPVSEIDTTGVASQVTRQASPSPPLPQSPESPVQDMRSLPTSTSNGPMPPPDRSQLSELDTSMYTSMAPHPSAVDSYGSPMTSAAPLPKQVPESPQFPNGGILPTKERLPSDSPISDRLRTELATAESTISQLERESATYQTELNLLRSAIKDYQDELAQARRGTGPATSTTASASGPTQPMSKVAVKTRDLDGFSPQTLGIIAAISFLIGYLFF